MSNTVKFSNQTDNTQTIFVSVKGAGIQRRQLRPKPYTYVLQPDEAFGSWAPTDRGSVGAVMVFLRGDTTFVALFDELADANVIPDVGE